MSEKKPSPKRGPFWQVAGIDPELTRKFRALCDFRGEDVGETLSAFMRQYVAEHGPKEATGKPKAK